MAFVGLKRKLQLRDLQEKLALSQIKETIENGYKNLKTCVAMYKQDIQKDRSLVVVLE